MNPETLNSLLAAKIANAYFNHIRKDAQPFLTKKEESEYFQKEYFLAAIGKYFSHK